MREFILAIDQGTSSSKSLILDLKGKIVSSHSVKIHSTFKEGGLVEQDPEQIWSSVVTSFKESLAKSGIKKNQISSIGITNQRETIVAWDKKTGHPCYQAIVWQCRRGESLTRKLKENGLNDKFYKITGLNIDPYFSAYKINWLIQNVSKIKELMDRNQICFGTIESFLIYRLTGQFISDISNASRTSLMNIATGTWDHELVNIFKININSLARIVPTCHTSLAKITHKDFPNIDISASIGDQQSALFGQHCFKKGEIKCTLGTGSFILYNTGIKRIESSYGLLSTVAWKIKEEKTCFALEGGAFVCGSLIKWLKQIDMIKKESDIEDILNNDKNQSNDQICFVPSLSGLGAPFWKSEVRGTISGISLRTSKADIIRAALEGLCLQNLDIINSMEKDAGKINNIKIDGGLSQNKILLKMQANFLGQDLLKAKHVESTALGAAFMAAIGSGIWQLKDIKNLWELDYKVSGNFLEKEKAKRDNWLSNINKLIK